MKKYLIAIASLIFTLGLWAFWFEPAYFRIAHYSVHIPQLADRLGYKIAVISDIHTGSPFNSLDKLKKIVAQTNSEDPDLILIVGDLVIHGVIGGNFVEPSKIAQELKILKARDGVYGVLGNHDWWYDAKEVSSALKQNGVEMLDEAVKIIGSGENSFWLMGIGDFWEGKPNVEQNLKNVIDDRPVIAFTHNPDIFPSIPKRVNLTIAGHTHGGQVYFPFIGRPIVPSKYGEKYAIGHIMENGHHLFVSPGLGTSMLPVRFLVPPEVSVLTVQ